ncbi:MAG: type II secretion system protein GspM [Sulfuricellaceae bacterium]|nr:type II secretion system protein GspM [Sulfuricellaceae bacterium]
MKKYWQMLSDRLNARNQREQMLISVTVLALVWTLVSTSLLDPLLARKKKITTGLTAQQEQLAALESQIQSIQTTGRPDPNIPTRVRMSALEQKLTQTQSALQALQENLVPSDKMAQLLQDVLEQQRGLKLVSLKTLPVSELLDGYEPAKTGRALPPGTPPNSAPVKAGSAGAAAPSGPVIYRHGVEISVSGNYANLLQYLTSMEELPWRVLWGKAEMHVETWPNATLTVTLYTLSMEKTWLSV